MVRDGLVALEDPVAEHLPAAPPVNGRPITLEDLATHRSGLPRLPSGMLIQGYTTNRKDPYAGLDDARMRRAIAETKPKRAPGGKVAYSNYGYGLLGYALAQRAGRPYGELLRERVTGHLGLTHIALDTPGLTQGHGFFGRATPSWDLASLAGAGGLRSTAREMLAYLAIHSTDGPLAQAARDTRVRRADMGKLGVGLAWLILPANAIGGLQPRAADARRRDRGLPCLCRGRSGDRWGGRRARQPGAVGDRARHRAHASAVSWSASTRSSAATSSGGANR